MPLSNDSNILSCLYFFFKITSFYFRMEFFNWSLKPTWITELRWFLTDREVRHQSIDQVIFCCINLNFPAGRYSGLELSWAFLVWEVLLTPFLTDSLRCLLASWGRLVYKGLRWDSWLTWVCLHVEFIPGPSTVSGFKSNKRAHPVPQHFPSLAYVLFTTSPERGRDSKGKDMWRVNKCGAVTATLCVLK